MTAILSSIRRSACGVGRAILVVSAMVWPGSAISAEAERVVQGRELFLREWVPGDARSHHGDGLGPLYNDSSCVACHNQGAPGGGGPASKNVEIITLAGRNRIDATSQDELHPGFREASSVLLHHFGTDPEYRLWRLRRVEGAEFAEMAEIRGEQEIKQIKELLAARANPPGRALTAGAATARSENRTKGTLVFGSRVSLSRRNPTPLFGAGLIDAIPVTALRAAALKVHADFPTARGRLSYGADGKVGRFGWKAQTSTLKEFVESACAMELGLEVPKHSQPRSPLDLEGTKSAGLDLTQTECDALTAYVASLPTPNERMESSASLDGRAIFARVGCAACHVPKLGSIDGIYSDLLLHDMGSDLADGSSYYGSITGSTSGGPSPNEWRTPPLWGFRDSGPYLHDGRAETLEQAVALHGGQAEQSAKLFFALWIHERLRVQAFLNSLTAPLQERNR